jgi:hypothetical protein
MRRYNPNAKHELPGASGRKGTRLDLTAIEAVALLNHPLNCVEVIGKRQFIGVQNGRIYAFQDDNTGGYHAYPITGNELCADFPSVSRQVAQLLDTTVKRLSRQRD